LHPSRYWRAERIQAVQRSDVGPAVSDLRYLPLRRFLVGADDLHPVPVHELLVHACDGVGGRLRGGEGHVGSVPSVQG